MGIVRPTSRYRKPVIWTAGNTGLLLPGTVTDDSSYGTVSWSTPTNAKVEDATITQAIVSDGAQSHYLKATNFSVSVPAGSNILGILTRVKRKTGVKTSGEEAQDSSVRLVISNSVAGENRQSFTNWESSLTEITYGGPTTLWGLNLTQEIVTSSTFGFAISVTNLGLSVPSSVRCQIDVMKLVVYYESPSS